MSCPWIESRAKKDEEKTLLTVWAHDVGAEAEIQWLQGWTVQRNNWRTGGLL